MKKFMVSAILLLLALSVVVMAESATQEDMKAVESLVDVMSGKLGDYSDRLGETEQGLNQLGEEVKELESRVEGLDTNDKLLMERIEDKSVEETINLKIDALKKEIESFNTEFKATLETLAGKTALETLGDEFTAKVTESMNQIAGLEEQLRELDEEMKKNEAEDVQLGDTISGIQTRMSTKNEQMNSRVDAIETYVQQLKSEYTQTVDNLREELTDAIQSERETIEEKVSSLESENDKIKTDMNEFKDTLEANMKTEILKSVEDQIQEMKTSLNMRLKWMDINIKGIKEDLAENASKSIEDYAVLETKINDFQTETAKKLNTIDEALKSHQDMGTANHEQITNELVTAQEAFEKKLDENMWSINKRMKWMDIASGKLKADLEDAVSDLDSRIVLSGQAVQDLASDLEKTNAYNNQRFKLTYMSLAGLKEDIQVNVKTLEAVEKAAAEKYAELENVEAYNNQRFKLTYMSIADLKKDIQASVEALDTAEKAAAEKYAELENVEAYNNQRFKLTYMSIADLRKDVQEGLEALEASTGERITEVEQKLLDELASKVAYINMRMKWADISASKLKSDVEKQAKEIKAVSMEIKGELGQEVSLINQKLAVMDTQIERLDTEKAAQADVARLRREFDNVVDRVNTIAFSLAFEQGMTQKILSEIANIKEAADLLDTKVAILYAEYATKEMLEAEIAQVSASLQELEELTYALNEKTEQLIANKVWALNQRLKWVDITIKRAKDERAELKEYVLALETRLEEEINSKVAYINMRLKWTDISITKLKETKVEKKEYNETVTRLDTVKVDKETFTAELNRIDMRFDSLENNIETFKKETNTLLTAHKEMLEAKIDGNTELIEENTQLMKNNSSEIQQLEARIAELEKEVFPEEKNTSTLGVLVGFGLVVGLGMVLASAN